MKKVQFYSLYWPNTDQRIVQKHFDMMSHFDIPINYVKKIINHGYWMDNVCDSSNADIIVFFDIDCVPLSREKVFDAIHWVKENKSFLGVAQVSNHIAPAEHIYAAPAFFVVYRECLERLNTTFSDGMFNDVAERLSYRAEEIGMDYKVLYPTHYYKEPPEGKWRLHDKGFYGIGTVFEDTVYHLYQSRFSDNIELFVKHCDDIINKNLDLSEFIKNG